MSKVPAVRLTAIREIRERLRTRAFLAGVAIQVVIVLLIVVISAVSEGDGEEYSVGTAGAESTAIVDGLAKRDIRGVTIEAESVSDAAEASERISAGELDAALVDGELYAESSTDEALLALIQSAAGEADARASLERAGVGQAQIERAVNPDPLPVTEVDEDAENADGLAFLSSLLLYFGILGFGFVVTSGIVEEKGSRVVELILSAIRPSQLLTGKVIGIGVLGLLQLLLTAGVGIAAALISNRIELPSSTAATAVLVVLYFVLGYAFYACAFAVAGAMVSRQEDVGSVTTPLTLILVVGYLASFNVSDNPDGTLATVLTFIPATAPLVVPARAGVDGLPAGELAASIAILLVSTAGLIWLASRIYERAVLRVGAPLSFREILRFARSGPSGGG